MNNISNNNIPQPNLNNQANINITIQKVGEKKVVAVSKEFAEELFKFKKPESKISNNLVSSLLANDNNNKVTPKPPADA